MMNTKELIAEVVSLPAAERALVFESLLRSFNQPESEIGKKRASADIAVGNSKNIKKVSNAKRFAGIEDISIMGLRRRIAPLGLHMYANAYLEAARALPLPTVPFEPVRPFLVCHSIELGLKAFLSLHGATMLELSEGSCGHNLEAILQKADEKHLGKHVNITVTHKAEIRKASLYYGGKVFEYPAISETLYAYPSMPVIDILFEVATILVDSLRQPCLEAK